MGQSALMMAGYGVQGFAGMGGAYAQAQAEKSQADFQKQQYETNARLADLQADDAKIRGDKQATDLGISARGMVGDQRAAQAAQGIDVNSGSAMDVQASTAGMAAKDIATIKNNAWREAWGYQVNANDMEGKAKMAESAGNTNYSNTLLTGGMKFLSSGLLAGNEWYKGGGGSKDDSSSPDYSDTKIHSLAGSGGDLYNSYFTGPNPYSRQK